MLLLGDGEVRELLNVCEAVKLVEQVFRDKNLGRIQNPMKTYLVYDRYNGDHRFMPAYIEGLDVAGVKIVNTHPENRRKFGLPTVSGIIVLLNPEDGRILSIMDATWITAVKTAAASAVATKYLGRDDSEVFGLVGAGLQAVAHVDAFTCSTNISEVRVWSRTRRTVRRFLELMSERHPELRFVEAGEVAEAVRDCDVVTTLTPSRRPIVAADWISPGTHINAMGSDARGKHELEPEILRMAKVVVDDLEHCSLTGEINVALSKGLMTKEDVYAEIGEIILGEKPGRTSRDEVTVFASTGIAAQDVAVAYSVYKRAVEKGFGLNVDVSGPTMELVRQLSQRPLHMAKKVQKIE
ncbi:ornithine cyclodeaminase family protein [Candidatus Bathyarchaeota archaeon]|nr:MAG: ornithine cyclodeaminase family protein [Candidatus Bathyarchaeota archaeon]